MKLALTYVSVYRIIVGAPKGTFPGGLSGVTTGGSNPVSDTGLVYQCPVVNPGTCTGVFGNGAGNDRRLFDDARKCFTTGSGEN